MNWKKLDEIGQLEEIKGLSQTRPVLIFKHSTRCGISAMALGRLERKWEEGGIEPYFLDLIRHRDISNEIEDMFGVIHESPQAILIKHGTPIYEASHNGIDFDEMSSIAKESEAA